MKIQIPENVSVQLDLCHDLPLLSLYCFEVVIQNLLQNAVDAMPGVRGLLHFSVSTSSVTQEELPIGYVQLIVQDTGTGISEDILPRIFDLEFHDEARRREGQGPGPRSLVGP